MTTGKENRRVTILSDNDFMVNGYLRFVHGVRREDFLNKSDRFIALTHAEVRQRSGMTSFKLTSRALKKKDQILPNKDYIKLVE